MAAANRSFNNTIFGPLLSGDVVKTNDIPITPKATEAQVNTRVAIFCLDIVVDPR